MLHDIGGEGGGGNEFTDGVKQKDVDGGESGKDMV